MIAFALSTCVGAIFRKITRLWWMFDDPFHFNILKPVTIFGTLYNKALYNALGTPIFTPFFMMSLRGDLSMFGQNARDFYIHQLLVVMLLPAAEYLLLRLWCSRLTSAATALITCLAGPTLSIVPVLMLRHYIGGAVLAMAATILFVRALRSGSHRMTIASAIVYFLAAGTKEIFLPLPAVLLVLPEGTLRQRMRRLVPHAIAAVASAIWRIAVIGPKVGSYGFVVRPEERVGRIATLPFRAVQQFAGAGTWAAIAMTVAIVACALLLFVRVRAARVPLLVAIACALLPIMPVATELQPRWSFALWLAASIAVAFVPRAVARGEIIVGVVLLLAIAAHATEWPGDFRRFKRMSDEAHVFVDLPPGGIIRDAETPPVTLDQLAGLLGTKGKAVYDDLDLCADAKSLHRVFEYDARRREVVDIGSRPVIASCNSIRTMPLNAEFTFDEPGSFFWRLGPYGDGTYSFILGGRQAYEVHRDGGFRSPGLPALTFRIRYHSPAGWTTYSPDIKVDMIARRRMTFVRK
jgi:hypothetical protein